MALDAPAFFDRLVGHLRARAEHVRALSVMASMERWVQFEAAAMLSTERADFGLDGTLDDNQPEWLITCERSYDGKPRDIWIAHFNRGYQNEPTEGTVIELKAIHNNKNFLGRVASIRADMTPAWRAVPDVHWKRWAIIVATYVRYDPASHSTYAVLRDGRDIMSAASYWGRLRSELASEDDDAIPLEVADEEVVTTLAGTPYVDPQYSEDVAVKLLLARARDAPVER